GLFVDRRSRDSIALACDGVSCLPARIGGSGHGRDSENDRLCRQRPCHRYPGSFPERRKHRRASAPAPLTRPPPAGRAPPPGDKAGEDAAEMKAGVRYFRPEGVEHDVINATDGEYAFIEVELK